MCQLRDRMDQDMAMRGMSPHTRAAYLHYAAAFVRYIKKSPTELGTEHLREFLLHLLNAKNRSPSTIAVCVGTAISILRNPSPHRHHLRRPATTEDSTEAAHRAGGLREGAVPLRDRNEAGNMATS